MDVTQTLSGAVRVEPWGFEGLLLLLGLGIVISPFRMVIEFISTYPPLFSDGTWDLVTSMNSLSYNPYWGTLIIVEIIANLLFIALSLYLFFLYFKKKASFPKWYLLTALLTVIFIAGDSFVVSWVFPAVEFLSPENIQSFSVSLVPLCLWAPYLFKSERAKNTFTL